MEKGRAEIRIRRAVRDVEIVAGCCLILLLALISSGSKSCSL